MELTCPLLNPSSKKKKKKKKSAPPEKILAFQEIELSCPKKTY